MAILTMEVPPLASTYITVHLSVFPRPIVGSEPPAARWNNEVAESRSFSCPLSVLIFPYVPYQPANRGGSFLRNVGSFSHPELRSRGPFSSG